MPTINSMDNILLPEFLNFDVYKITDNNDNINIIYNNDVRKTMILIKNSDEAHLEFLTKILAAVKYDISKDVLLMSIEQKKQISLTNLIKDVDIDKVVLFDFVPKDIGLNCRLPNYFPLKMNEKTFLSADSLSQISKNKMKKKELWTALQKMFL